MNDLKYELAIALLALIQVLTAWVQEKRARDRYKALGRGIREVQISLRPGPFADEDTPCQSHVWDRSGEKWACKRCGMVRVSG